MVKIDTCLFELPPKIIVIVIKLCIGEPTVFLINNSKIILPLTKSAEFEKGFRELFFLVFIFSRTCL